MATMHVGECVSLKASKWRGRQEGRQADRHLSKQAGRGVGEQVDRGLMMQGDKSC